MLLQADNLIDLAHQLEQSDEQVVWIKSVLLIQFAPEDTIPFILQEYVSYNRLHAIEYLSQYYENGEKIPEKPVKPLVQRNYITLDDLRKGYRHNDTEDTDEQGIPRISGGEDSPSHHDGTSLS